MLDLVLGQAVGVGPHADAHSGVAHALLNTERAVIRVAQWPGLCALNAHVGDVRQVGQVDRR